MKLEKIISPTPEIQSLQQEVLAEISKLLQILNFLRLFLFGFCSQSYFSFVRRH